MDDDSGQKVWPGEKRNMRRIPFTESAEVIDLASQGQFSLRTTDVGTGGCFLDAVFPLPVGSRVRVILHQALKDFQAEGQVVYSQPGLGMGIAFDELNSEQRLSLMRLIE
jgi:hypothetical protein